MQKNASSVAVSRAMTVARSLTPGSMSPEHPDLWVRPVSSCKRNSVSRAFLDACDDLVTRARCPARPNASAIDGRGVVVERPIGASTIPRLRDVALHHACNTCVP